MLGDDKDLFGAMHEIHGATDCRNALRADTPVCQIPALRNLQCPKDRNIEMAAADHREAVRMMEERSALLQRHCLFAGIDEVPVLFARLRRLAEIEDPVFRMEDRLPARRLVAGDHFGKADTEIDIGAIDNVLRRAPGDLGVGQLDLFLSDAGHA
ncbi:hypothetical protein D3C71_1232200 [compost metagenome]